jgi:hypothetical protein
MGWYHYEIANGRDPSATDEQPTSCPDGTCSNAKPQSSTTACARQPTEELYLDNGPIYHLCEKSNWRSSIRIEKPYFPPTFWLDGRFTRSCCKKDSLVDTANEYYKVSRGDWICIEMDPTILRNAGIAIACHRAPESTIDQPVQCLKIYGGISVSMNDLVTNIYAMQRHGDGTFVGMTLDDTVPKMIQIKHPVIHKDSTILATQKEAPCSVPKATTTTEKTERKKIGSFWTKKN